MSKTDKKSDIKELDAVMAEESIEDEAPKGDIVPRETHEAPTLNEGYGGTVIDTSTPMGMIAMAIDRGADPSYLEKLLALQERWEANEARKAFTEAMTMVQASLPKVIANSRNDQTNSTYAKLDAISEAIKPVYTSKGFSTTFSQGECPIPEYIRILGTLRHKGGHSEPYYIDLPLDIAGIKGSVNKTKIHATGSTFSYGRRYLTCMMFDVATGDDNDGNVPEEIPRISEEQYLELHSKAVENDILEPFMKWMETQMKINDMHDIPEPQFERVMNKLNSSIKARNQGNA